MRKFFTIVILLGTMVLSAQGFSLNASEDGFSMSVSGMETTTNSSSSTSKSSNTVIDEIVSNLEKLQKLYTGKLSKLDGKRADKIVDNIYELLAEIPTDASNETTTTTSNGTNSNSSTINININDEVTTTPSTPVVEAEPETNSAMPSGEFSTLVSRIGSESFADDKLRVLRTAASNHSFKVSQIVTLLGQFNFADDKLSALRISYPGCVDPKNNYQILDAFTFSGDKEEAEQIINY
jgi:hypothetical protein